MNSIEQDNSIARSVMREIRRKVFTGLAVVAAPLGALASCGVSETDTLVSGAGKEWVSTTAHEEPDETSDEAEEPVPAPFTNSTSDIVNFVCKEGTHIQGDKVYGSANLHPIYSVAPERADNCFTKEFNGRSAIIALTYFSGSFPESGPINHSVYCDEGTISSRPAITWGETTEGIGWVIEDQSGILDGREVSSEEQQAFMEGIAQATEGNVWVGSCPANQSTEYEPREGMGSVENEEDEAYPQHPSEGVGILEYENGMELVPGTVYCDDGHASFAEVDAEGEIALHALGGTC